MCGFFSNKMSTTEFYENIENAEGNEKVQEYLQDLLNERVALNNKYPHTVSRLRFGL